MNNSCFIFPFDTFEYDYGFRSINIITGSLSFHDLENLKVH